MRLILCLFSLSLLLLNSCEPVSKTAQTEDDTNPFFRQAAKYMADTNYHAAIKEYEKAIQANPLGSRAHKEIATIYGNNLGDYVGSIYHYQRYLDAKPDAEDKDQIQSLIDKAKLDFGLSLPFSPQQNAEESARISRENIELKQALAQAQKQIAERDSLLAQAKSGTTVPAATTTAPVVESAPIIPSTNPATVKPVATTVKPASTNAPAATPTTTAPVAVATAPAVPARSHVIASGDSLWKIAKKYYPEDVKEGVEKIKQANPEATSNPKNLKLGTTLVIP